MKVSFNDQQRIQVPLRKELDAAWHRIVDNNSYIGGSEVEAFEQEFGKYCATNGAPRYVAGVSNGLDGLELTLRACDVRSKDEVIVPANTFNASVAAIIAAEAYPILVDCCTDTKLMDLNQLESKLTSNTRAIMPVHLYGQQVPMRNLLTDFQGIVIIEDACQAHGSLQEGNAPGKYSHAAVFSFYPGKNLGAFGDAGAVVSDSQQVIEKIKQLRNYGQTSKYHHDILGSNKRLDALQAAILRVKLPHLDDWNESRRKTALEYFERLKGVGDLRFPMTLPGNLHACHLFVVETDKRDELQKYLAEQGVDTGIHYPVPIHLQPAFGHLGYLEGDFPNAEAASKRGLSLPLFPGIRDDEIGYVVDSVRKFYSRQ